MTIEDYIADHHSVETTKTYMYYINHYLAVNKNAKDMEYMEIVHYFDELERRGKSPDNRKVILNAVKRYYDWLSDIERYRDDHPCERMKLRGGRSKDIMLNNIFTTEELELLLDREDRYQKIRNKNKLLVSFLIYQGLAPAEVCAMKVDDIDMDTGFFVARGTEKISRRRLELKSSQTLLLFKYLKNRDQLLERSKLKTDKLFITYNGTAQTVDAVSRMFHPYKALFPDKVLNPQNIRMSVVYNMVNSSSVSLERALELTGLKWMSSISKYLKPDKDGDMKIIQEFHPLREL